MVYYAHGLVDYGLRISPILILHLPTIQTQRIMNTKYILTTLFFFPLLFIQWNPSENQSEQNYIYETCRALADLRIEDTNLLSAAVVPAGDELPEYCRVLGYVRPAINFEIRLPTSGWAASDRSGRGRTREGCRL